MPRKLTPEQEVKRFVIGTVIDHLTEKFKRSKFKPKGGFTPGSGWGIKTYGDFDSISVGCRCYDDIYEGRIMINLTSWGTPKSKGQYKRVISSLDNVNLEGINIEHFFSLHENRCHWFEFKID